MNFDADIKSEVFSLCLAVGISWAGDGDGWSFLHYRLHFHNQNVHTYLKESTKSPSKSIKAYKGRNIPSNASPNYALIGFY